MLDSSPFFNMIELGETSSTNTFLQSYRPPKMADITLVTAEYQTSGRGQTGNHWESARGLNLLFSLLVYPFSLPASQMFLLSEAVALSIRETVEAVLSAVAQGDPSFTGLAFPLVASARSPLPPVTVKWPNDIYVGNDKIAGILIENDLCGRHISSSIIGCGVNINQTEFLSDAPNPVSLRQLTGCTFERRLILERIVQNFCRRNANLLSQADAMHREYLSVLFRGTGIHPFRDAQGTFMAQIEDVEPSGHLCLRDTNGRLRRYAFKEVEHQIGESARSNP
ncbi:MAG: biotin--[acetyl-CoA-carboxylase] ligase family protein [Bacteroidales bacterium]|nr:biotin--[acetyl-CoA-carboxylase] ligase family protein [Bacteroidales bacterium]